MRGGYCGEGWVGGVLGVGLGGGAVLGGGRGGGDNPLLLRARFGVVGVPHAYLRAIGVWRYVSDSSAFSSLPRTKS